ncbi:MULTISPECIES: hypothetical protein [Xanthomonas]|uniref:hypothetical protein n=1 Tax=Xanthomonas TaxID=338 RepID=UPI00136AEC96|nr:MULTISPECIES: hypothetical protein [Xanthomonas]MBB6365734.1 type VI protein secretion system component VasF [Xanthomonas sp. F10]MCI2246064.1 hypothetical protein [Xanthomonas indica]MXV34653.1 hypothetical protein [Xanthomonas sp. LMG 8989]UYC13862.1 hypothetical protein NUG21_09080 [Xanthomonas sp. CFBP 8445]
MRRHGFLLSRHDTDLWCRELHIDLRSLARAQRSRRRRRRALWLLAVLCLVAAVSALLWFGLS